MENDIKERVLTWFSRGLLIVIFFGGLVFLWPTYQRGSSLRQQEVDLDAKIAEKRREINELADNQRRFKTDRDFVEMIARQNRRVFPGELVFVFEEDR